MIACYTLGYFELDDTIIVSFQYVKLFLQASVILFSRLMSKRLIQNAIDRQGLQMSNPDIFQSKGLMQMHHFIFQFDVQAAYTDRDRLPRVTNEQRPIGRDGRHGHP